VMVLQPCENALVKLRWMLKLFPHNLRAQSMQTMQGSGQGSLHPTAVGEGDKVYGNNRVFCKGRFISGPDSGSCIASLLMICAPSVIWQVTVGVFFTTEYSLFFPLLAGVLQLGSLKLLLATAFSDPGIMPRQKEYREHYDGHIKTSSRKQPSRYHDLVLRGHPFKLKYCSTCHIYRPPRSAHCSVCDNCIERFDHHCPWIGNCIGKRNYWLFYFFVTVTSTLNVFMLATSVVHLSILYQRFQDSEKLGSGDALVRAMQEEPLSAALVLYCTGTVWFTVGLCMYHNYLVCINQTTYEHIKCTYSNGNNPFYRGIVDNFRDTLCSRVHPRYLDASSGKMLWPRAMSEDAREMVSLIESKNCGRGATPIEKHNNTTENEPDKTAVCI